MKEKHLRFITRITLISIVLAMSLISINMKVENKKQIIEDTKIKEVSIASPKIVEPIKSVVKEPVKPVVVPKAKVSPSRGMVEPKLEELGNFRLTAYDLSVESCGKSKSHEAFGITKTGYNLKNKSLLDRKIAVDPKIIPLKSKVYITFPKDKRYVSFYGKNIDLNGYYTAVDTGGAINGRDIDLFVGGTAEYINNLCKEIGVVKVKVSR